MMDYTQAAEYFFSCMKKKEGKSVLLKLSEQTQGEPLVLMYLFKNTGETIVPSNIAEFIGTSSARVASILNNLEDKGMISREISRDDRRKILVSLTDKGRRATSAHRTRSINRVSQVFQQMGEEKTTEFIDNWNLFLEIGKNLVDDSDKEGCDD
ncbi:MarR family winged helix-turn-helix transcriptional regulator [Lactococcus sp.]|uniref:MarR family winged helix-turn-helix transcriptional regulator n=1 Tax=Lactococcus sp. TaxID=44273 RepID=UPI0035AF8D3D